jgi:hypothetical protein
MSLQRVISDLERIKVSLENYPAFSPDKTRQISDTPLRGAELSILEIAEKIYSSRRRRAEFFPEDELFGEPAWDILLDLFIAQCRGKAISVTSACIGSQAPNTTALRWLKALESRGFVITKPDLRDKRRQFVELTPEAYQRMSAYLQKVAK